MLFRLCICAVVLSFVSYATSLEKQTVFVNGQWFDGTAFQKRSAIIKNGKIEFRESDFDPGSAEVIDLKGGFVIPPYCEAHNHNIGVGKAEEKNKKYLDAGVFYIQILNNAPQTAEPEKEFWARPETADVAFAHGGLTGVGGHPVEILEGIRKGGGYPQGTVLADAAYFEIDSVTSLEKKWPVIASYKPDIIKLYLQFSEAYEERKSDPNFFGNRGLSPEAFNRALELAHKDGLRVAAHVTSAHDFHLAVAAGSDVIAHLPGYMSVETISPDDAKLASEKNITVITTASLAPSLSKKSGNIDAIQKAQKSNLRLLKEHGVKLIIGSDSWGDTSHHEVKYLRSFEVFTDLELLRMWTTDCAKTIFPKRKIGTLESGAEADFIVLEGNPLVDFTSTQRIRLRVKAGNRL